MFTLQQALPVGAQIVLAAIMLAFLVRLVLALDGVTIMLAINRHAFVPFVILFMMALVTERLFYVAGRFLEPTGVNLWQVHPAPEFMATSIVATAFFAQAPLIAARHRGRVSLPVRLLCEAAFWMGFCILTMGFLTL